MDEVIQVVIADDHPIFREGLKLMIRKEKEKDINIIGEADNGKELISIVETMKPHIVLTDIIMPQMGGIAATKLITENYPDIGVIALSTFDQEYLVSDMIDAGALGYLLKNAPKAQIVDAIRSVYLKQCYYCNTISAKVKKQIASSSFNPFGKVMFNDTEVAIIKLLCEELTSKEIAARLYLSPRTTGRG